MRVNEPNSSFQSVILELVRQKLNMMMSEIFQLDEDVDCQNYEKLTKIVLREISHENVQSAHMTSAGAKKIIQILDQLNAHQEYNGVVKPEVDQNIESTNNPFSGLPF